MNRYFAAVCFVAATACTPVVALGSVVTEFFPVTPSTNVTSTISYTGTYATPAAAPFAAASFSFSAVMPAQFYAPAGFGSGMEITGVNGTYIDNGVTTSYSNATIDMLTQIVASYNDFGVESRTDETLFNLNIPSLLATGDNYFLSMVANNFLYAENVPLVSNPLTPPPLLCLTCTPVIYTVPSANFSVLSGGFADYTPPYSPDPSNTINAGGVGTVTTELPVAVPEPRSLFLLGGALVMLGMVVRRRRRQGDNRVLRIS